MSFTRTDVDNLLERMALEKHGKSFYGRIAGTTHQNLDGSDRQRELLELRPCDELQLEHEPDNEHDGNAVRVMTSAGRQIGYLEARLAGETLRRAKRGLTTRAFFSNLTGGHGFQSHGVTIALLVYNAPS